MFIDFLNDPIGFLIDALPGSGASSLVSGPVFQSMRNTFLVLDAILVIMFFFSFAKSWKYRPKLHPGVRVVHKTFTLRDDVLQKRWDTIRTRVEGGSADGMHLAVIEADKLVDDALKQMGLEGEHMADRLGKISDTEVRTLDRLWRAHRVRNDLVHSPGFSLSAGDAKRVIDDYEAFLKEVKVLR
jgi:transposase